ncbi:MAG TPA: patatin-like phospholipase family protein, partial [Nitrospiria bacterium]|nr:patatin-like phospholipase family protein [Nitrospiria bacterium]
MVSKRNGKIALALSGGGITGWLYEIGSLTALDDFLEEGFSVRDFDIYIGVSAGATAAALIANNVSPEELFFANLRQKESSYYFERKDIFGLAVGEIFRSFGRLVKSIIPIIRYYIKTKEDIYFIDLLDHLQECQPSGFYTLEPF